MFRYHHFCEKIFLTLRNVHDNIPSKHKFVYSVLNISVKVGFGRQKITRSRSLPLPFFWIQPSKYGHSWQNLRGQDPDLKHVICAIVFDNILLLVQYVVSPEIWSMAQDVKIKY